MQTLTTLSSYLPRPLAAEIITHPECNVFELATRMDAVVLFADMSGFTPLTAALGALGPQGAEEMTRVLNELFTPLIERSHRWGGVVGKFAGDALTVLFFGDAAEPRALACALELRDYMRTHGDCKTRAGDFPVRMKFGLAAGEVLQAIVGTERRAEFIFAGAALNQAGLAENHAQPGSIVLHASLLARLPAGLVELAPCVPDHALLLGLNLTVEPQPLPPLPTVDDPAQAQARLCPLVPRPIYERICSGSATLVNEHRRATCVFLNFAGIDYAAPEALAQLERYAEAVIEQVNRYGGFLHRIAIDDKGSSMLILFGAPTAHENDEERALLFALAVRGLAQEMPFIAAQRIGINSGQLFTGNVGAPTRHEYTAIGDAINLAARLMQTAAPGQILVGAETQAPAAERFQWEPLPPFKVKGKPEPVTAYDLRGRERLPHFQAPRYAQPMVGRRAELRRLAGLLERVLRSRKFLTVGLTAEAGMGKSRLAAEVIAQALAFRFWAYGGSGVSYGATTPYLAWRTILQGLLDLDMEAAPAAQIAAAREALAEVDPLLVGRLPLLQDILGLHIPDNELTAGFDANLRRQSLFALVVDLLRHRAAAGPVLLVLEDAHWLDELSQALAQHVAAFIEDAPIFFLTLYRPPEIEGQAALWAEPPPHFHEVRLEPFAVEESAELIRLKLAGRQLPAAFVEQIQARAQGNPFFVDEFINLMQAQGVDVDDPDALSAVAVPTSLQTLIVSRLDQLAEDEKLTVSVASVIGRLFHAGWLLAIYPKEVREALLRQSLTQLTALDLIALDRPEPELTYLFKHALTQEVAYSTLAFAVRRTLHERVAAYIEQTYAEDLQGWYGILAYHFRQAERWAEEFAYVQLAAEQAAHQYALQQAAALYTRALELAEVHGFGTAELIFDLHRARYRQYATIGNPDALKVDSLAMTALAPELDITRQLQARIYEAAHIADVSRSEAAELYEEITALAQAHDDHANLAEARTRQGWLYFAEGDYAQGKVLLAQVVAKTDARTWQQSLKAGAFLGWIAYDEADYAQARQYWLQCLALAQQYGDKYYEARGYYLLGVLEEVLGYCDRSLDYFQRGLDLTQAIGSRNSEATIIATMGEAALGFGDFVRAEQNLQRALEMAHYMDGVSFTQSYYRSRLAEALLMLGGADNLARAETLSREGLELGRAMQGPEPLGWLLHARGRVLAARGNLAGAREVFEEAAQIRRELKQVDCLLPTLAELGEVLLQSEALTDALALVDEIEPLLFPEEGEGQESQDAAFVACRILKAAGQGERARRYLQRAHEILQLRLGRIESEVLRRSFLENLPRHRALLAAYAVEFATNFTN